VRWIGGSYFRDGLVSHIRKATGGDNYQGHESSRRTSVVSGTPGFLDSRGLSPRDFGGTLAVLGSKRSYVCSVHPNQNGHAYRKVEFDFLAAYVIPEHVW